MEYYSDEILNKLCKWCNLRKSFTRSMCNSGNITVGQYEGGICFDCYKKGIDEYICDECIHIVNNNHIFSNEYIGYINIKNNYNFHGHFSFCKECLKKRNYIVNINHMIEHNKNKYINNLLSNYNGINEYKT
tara:strand:- start:62 stop:457 length:396 start_codon:yes stop_codon:yes gene_type:complete